MQIDTQATVGKRRGKPVSRAAVVGLTLGFIFVLLMRHDFWNWHSARPLLFGLIPVGLWWQGLVSVAASVLMALCVRFAWPEHLEDMDQEVKAGE